jgi:hypothetical protein
MRILYKGQQDIERKGQQHCGHGDEKNIEQHGL